MRAITTLNRIRDHNPCLERWQHLLKGLFKAGPDDEPISIACVLRISGFHDAAWATRAVGGSMKQRTLFACDCAEAVLPLADLDCFRRMVEVTRLHALGKATKRDLEMARLDIEYPPRPDGFPELHWSCMKGTFQLLRWGGSLTYTDAAGMAQIVNGIPMGEAYQRMIPAFLARFDSDTEPDRIVINLLD